MYRDVRGQRLTHVRTILVSAVVAAVTGTAVPTAAAPPPGDGPSGPTARYQQLSGQAERTNEDLLAARDDLAGRRAQLARARATAARAQDAERSARAQQDRFRGRVERFIDASYRGAYLSRLSALLAGKSPRDFLDRASALELLSSQNNQAVHRLAKAVRQASAARARAADARRRARDATDAAARLVRTVERRKQDLDGQIGEVRQELAALSTKQRSQLSSPGDQGVFVGPPGALGKVVQAAVAQRGKPYEWGAAGPDSFDCSGLTMWAYAKVGIGLPHSSRAQYTRGTPVDAGEWQPGDLLFWGSSPSTIHHEALYVGDGKIVHASTEGVPVKVDPISGGGSDYFGARRIAG